MYLTCVIVLSLSLTIVTNTSLILIYIYITIIIITIILSIELSWNVTGFWDQVWKTLSREAHRCCTGHSERPCLGWGSLPKSTAVSNRWSCLIFHVTIVYHSLPNISTHLGCDLQMCTGIRTGRCIQPAHSQLHKPRNYSQSTSSHLGLATGGQWVDEINYDKLLVDLKFSWSLEPSTTIPGSFLNF